MAVDDPVVHALSGLPGLGVLLWGSEAKGEATSRSDLDICIVTGPGVDRTEILREAWRRLGGRADVKVFEDLPMYLQGEVFQHHMVLWTPDEPALFEYLRPFWKRWHDQAHRQRLDADDARALFSA